ncbi:MAG: BolA family transcriptional regulator [Gammaproteobacteria bacterium]|nr:BolA family transcriptional regulator [Gammaproteobacteria bacterium]
MNTQKTQVLKDQLTSELAPESLEIRDDSALHTGHAGSLEGGHFHVMIVSSKFLGLTPLARHRLVFEALGDLKALGVHALSIDARIPS